MSEFSEFFSTGSNPELKEISKTEKIVEIIKQIIINSNGNAIVSTDNYKVRGVESNKYVGEILFKDKKYYFTCYSESKKQFGKETIKGFVVDVFEVSTTTINDGDHYPTYTGVDYYDHTEIRLNKKGEISNPKKDITKKEGFDSKYYRHWKLYNTTEYEKFIMPIEESLKEKTSELEMI